MRPRTELLYVGGRDQTRLVEGMPKQLQLVRTALADQLDVPVRGVLCLPDADGLPPFTTVRVHEVDVDGPEGAAWVAARRGELSPEHVLRVARRLERAFPRR